MTPAFIQIATNLKKGPLMFSKSTHMQSSSPTLPIHAAILHLFISSAVSSRYCVISIDSVINISSEIAANSCVTWLPLTLRNKTFLYISKGIEPSTEALRIATEKRWREYEDVASQRIQLCQQQLTRRPTVGIPRRQWRQRRETMV